MLTYQDVVAYAQSRGDAHRSTFSGLRILRSTKTSPPPHGITRSTSILESGTSTHKDDGGDEDILVLPEDSVPTTDLPTTLPSAESGEQLLYTGHTPAAPLAYGGPDTTPNRVGWVDRQPVQQPRFICHLCYLQGHTSPHCTTKMSDLTKVVKNYEGPSPSDKGRVPDASYKAAKNFVEALEREKLT